ncbi:MAG: N-acetylmuramoyl-L-alanine amidase [Clostridium sp.]|nr:N-acetylmuramoyl-L-alanine amidase [Clostridium sp.]MDU7084734.1 N-acetylmuramoyl-L-alanine amidase [Clostridium sp.]
MKSVTLDPGKGGNKTGFTFDNLVEKEINLTIALECREELMRHGVEVVMTRDDDTYAGYSQRILIANKNHSDAFVSIHCNFGEGSLCELVYSIHSEKGLSLASSIGDEIRKLGQPAIKIYNKIGYGLQDYNAVIREADMDSIIIKCAYLDNEFDRSFIHNLEKQQEFGTAIAKGILNYFNLEYKEK